MAPCSSPPSPPPASASSSSGGGGGGGGGDDLPATWLPSVLAGMTSSPVKGGECNGAGGGGRARSGAMIIASSPGTHLGPRERGVRDGRACSLPGGLGTLEDRLRSAYDDGHDAGGDSQFAGGPCPEGRGTSSSTPSTSEPLLADNPGRYTMFPVQ